MSDEEILTKLRECADSIERTIATQTAEFAARISQLPPDLVGRTPNDYITSDGRPILAGLYADLARVLIAIHDIERCACGGKRHNSESRWRSRNRGR